MSLDRALLETPNGIAQVITVELVPAKISVSKPLADQAKIVYYLNTLSPANPISKAPDFLRRKTEAENALLELYRKSTPQIKQLIYEKLKLRVPPGTNSERTGTGFLQNPALYSQHLSEKYNKSNGLGSRNYTKNAKGPFSGVRISDLGRHNRRIISGQPAKPKRGKGMKLSQFKFVINLNRATGSGTAASQMKADNLYKVASNVLKKMFAQMHSTGFLLKR